MNFAAPPAGAGQRSDGTQAQEAANELEPAGVANRAIVAERTLNAMPSKLH
jgi:hypothetical protein